MMKVDKKSVSEFVYYVLDSLNQNRFYGIYDAGFVTLEWQASALEFDVIRDTDRPFCHIDLTVLPRWKVSPKTSKKRVYRFFEAVLRELNFNVYNVDEGVLRVSNGLEVYQDFVAQKVFEISLEVRFTLPLNKAQRFIEPSFKFRKDPTGSRTYAHAVPTGPGVPSKNIPRYRF